MLLEPVRRPEQDALGHQRREVPIERRSDARTFAADRRDRREIIAIGRVELEELELVERHLRGRREQRFERRIREVLVAE